MAGPFDLNYIRELAHKWKSNTLSETEREDLARWEASHRDELLKLPGDSGGPEAVKTRMYSRLQQAIDHDNQKSARRRWLAPWLPYATAAILIATMVSTWYIWSNRSAKIDTPPYAEEILPGGHRSTLTLADGRTLDLSETQSGIIVSKNHITYADGNTLTVIPNAENLKSEGTMLELTTPNGGTYEITLPDGSRVWLNAQSTLRYPSRFTGDERVVYLKGEGYFEVQQKVKAMRNLDNPSNQKPLVPFLVKTDQQTVEVLGTAFNISAYADEPETRTTLVTGRVRVKTPASDSKTAAILNPGEQSIVRGARTQIVQIDPSTVTAWKDGWITFQDKSFAQIMQEVERWYDIEVNYEGPIPHEVGYGMVRRTDNLSTVLRLLEAGGIRFQLQNRVLTIMNETGKEGNKP